MNNTRHLISYRIFIYNKIKMNEQAMLLLDIKYLYKYKNTLKEMMKFGDVWFSEDRKDILKKRNVRLIKDLCELYTLKYILWIYDEHIKD